MQVCRVPGEAIAALKLPWNVFRVSVIKWCKSCMCSMLTGASCRSESDLGLETSDSWSLATGPAGEEAGEMLVRDLVTP